MASASGPVETNPRFDWYQSESHVVLTVFVKQVKPNMSTVKISEHDVTIALETETGLNVSRTFILQKPVTVETSTFKILPSKLEIKLSKRDGGHWTGLEAAEKPKVEAKTPRNWDKVVSELVDKGEETDVNQLFQKIYEEGSDEVKKAMNKSFLESGGTELNTNWGSVGKDKVSIKPPDGLEWRTWDK